jgi:hypothetical protein
MMDLERELSEMLAERAGRATNPPMQRTLRRVRVRRAVNAGLMGAAVIAVLVAGTAVLRAFPDGGPEVVAPSDEVTTEGPYGFTSEPGEFPTIASGTFRDATWELTSETITNDGIDSVRMDLSITTADGEVTSDQMDVVASDDILMMQLFELEGRVGDADVVFGATIPVVESVTVEVADGNETKITAHRFMDYDSRSTITGDFYLAFIPAGAPGFVIARDALGIDLDEEPFGRVSRAPRIVASGLSAENIRWGVMFGGLGEQGCIVFMSAEEGSKCYPREHFDPTKPLLMTVFDRPEVMGVTAVVGNEVARVRLEVDGEEAVELPWFSVRDSGPTWSLRMVAVGLKPGTTGRLVALDGNGDVLTEERF